MWPICLCTFICRSFIYTLNYFWYKLMICGIPCFYASARLVASMLVSPALMLKFHGCVILAGTWRYGKHAASLRHERANDITSMQPSSNASLLLGVVLLASLLLLWVIGMNVWAWSRLKYTPCYHLFSSKSNHIYLFSCTHIFCYCLCYFLSCFRSYFLWEIMVLEMEQDVFHPFPSILSSYVRRYTRDS
jgi:hypothetical protein